VASWFFLLNSEGNKGARARAKGFALNCAVVLVLLADSSFPLFIQFANGGKGKINKANPVIRLFEFKDRPLLNWFYVSK
jgi:hypothetical protein